MQNFFYILLCLSVNCEKVECRCNFFYGGKVVVAHADMALYAADRPMDRNPKAVSDEMEPKVAHISTIQPLFSNGWDGNGF